MTAIRHLAVWTTLAVCVSAVAASPIINEFMAANDSTLADEDGEFSDWIEIHNPTDAAINLDGWHLTDEQDNLNKWRFPAVTLPAGGYLVVFASGNDRAAAGSELHTDFGLSKGGEYLALVQPDGITIEQVFAPEYPGQVEDVSYGLGVTVSDPVIYVATGQTATALVPTAADAPDEGTWMQVGFDDAGWISGPTGVGYDQATTYESLIGLDVDADMNDVNTSVWIRIPFTVTDPSAVLSLQLRMKYDDGFVAYLNGQVIAGESEQDTPPMPWNAAASAGHADSEALVFVDHDVSAYKGSLITGENILAIHGLNWSVTSSDMLILPELHGGLDPGGEAVELRYFTSPTPGAANATGVLGYIDEVGFSVERGFNDVPFSLALSTDVPDTTIRYTTDGTQPTSSHGTVYSGPISITTTTVVRAMANKSGYMSAASVSHTYIFLDDVLDQTDDENSRGFPDTWYAGASSSGSYDRRTRPADYEMDPDIVYSPTYAPRMIEAMTSIPTVSLALDPDDLWNSSSGIYPNSVKRASTSPMWEKPASMELIDPSGVEQGFCINAGARISGGASRFPAINDKQSFRVAFRGEYGPRKLEYDFFGDEDVDQYDTILFRANWADSWLRDSTRDEDLGVGWMGGATETIQYLRDVFLHDAFRDTGNIGVRGRLVHLYLNGVYWGLYTALERPDHSFAAEHYGGSKDDYDLIKGNTGESTRNGTLKEGSRTAWDTMFNTWFDASDGTNIDGQVSTISDADLADIAQYLDVDQFIDYMITLWTYNRLDFPRKNWFAFCKRDPAGGPPLIPFTFQTWDSEASVGLGGDADSRKTADRWNNTDAANDTGPVRIYRRLITNATFRRRWGDQVQQLMLGDGPLNPANSIARWMARANEVDTAIIGESARWGDSSFEWNEREGDPQGPPVVMTRDVEWITERARVIDYLTLRTGYALQQMAERDLYPALDPPEFNQDGGQYDPGFMLSFTHPNGGGLVWFTLDGTDPQSSLSAIPFTAPVPLSGSLVVRARVGFAGIWSALVEASFMPTGGPTLAVTEIMYNPAPPRQAGPYLAQDYEFIEIRNIGGTNVPLNAITLVDGVTFDFTDGAVGSLLPGEYVLVVKNAAAFADRYGAGLPVAGAYVESLNNDGEAVALAAAGIVFKSFTYDDASNWPGRADGRGASLERIDTAMDPDDDDAWRSSTEYGGTPGSPGAGAIVDIVINEVLTHTDPDPTDSIELYNASGGAVDLSGWFLSDSFGDFWKFRIPNGTVLAPGQYVVFDEYDFNPTGLTPDPGDDLPEHFGLSGAHGDDVWLMEADGSENLLRFVDHVEFGGAFLDQSFGRWPNGSGELYPMTSFTSGSVNSGPKPATILISEVMYNPGGPEVDDLEFVEICNPNVVDRDLTGWRLRDGVDYDFDPGTILRVNTPVVVLSFDPTKPENAARVAAFRAAYGIDTSVDLLGGWSGKLNNDGERIQLQEPDTPPVGEPYYTPHVVHDEVIYDDLAPWPVVLTTESLHRSASGGWGNDAANWTAGTPSPGTGIGLNPGDIDGDGDVDLDDFVILKRNFGQTGVSRAEGDLDGDNSVDLDDFVIFKMSFGT